MKNKEENTHINQANLSKKTWESPCINSWEIEEELNITAGIKFDGVMNQS